MHVYIYIYIGRSTDALTKTNEHGLGVKMLLSHGLRAVFFTHLTQQVGSLPLANNIKHSFYYYYTHIWLVSPPVTMKAGKHIHYITNDIITISLYRTTNSL